MEMSGGVSGIFARNPYYRGVVPAAAAALDTEVPGMAYGILYRLNWEKQKV